MVYTGTCPAGQVPHDLQHPGLLPQPPHDGEVGQAALAARRGAPEVTAGVEGPDPFLVRGRELAARTVRK